MNDQDRDLIAALAEGRLGTDAAEVALARIESDPEMSSEYQAQVAAVDFLGSAEPARMTTAERTTLHANLTEQLGLSPSSAPSPAPAKRKPWWAPAFGIATAAVVVTAVVIFPGVATNESADDAGDTFAISDTDATAGSAEPPPVSAEEDRSGGELTESGLDGSSEISVYETNAIELDELLDEAEGADSTDEIQQRLSDLSLKSTVDLDAAAIDACIEKLRDQIPPGVAVVRVLGASVEDVGTTIHLGFDYGEGVEDGLSFAFENCSLVRHADQG